MENHCKIVYSDQTLLSYWISALIGTQEVIKLRITDIHSSCGNTVPDLSCLTSEKNRIYHRSPMQTEKFQPEGKRMMPETRFTSFPALSVDPRVGISRSASKTDD